MRILASMKQLVIGSAALLAVGFILLLILGRTVTWVGHTDLEVCFVVTDADTGQPIPEAIVHIRAEPSGFCDDTAESQFTITPDSNGRAKYVCTNCMCFGSKGLLEDTYAVHLPWWWFHATASQYSATAPAYLDVPENVKRVQRGAPFATITVPIRLPRKTAERSDERGAAVSASSNGSSITAPR
jgi:hypothetical protein